MQPIHNNTMSRGAGTPIGWRAVGATLSRPQPAWPRRATACRTVAGFTLTEILIVIGLIVLVIALAVPAFNVMTGGRSVDAAMNTLSAVLGRPCELTELEPHMSFFSGHISTTTEETVWELGRSRSRQGERP